MTTARGDRSIIASLGAHEKWLRCADRTAATEAARSAFQNRFTADADPDGILRDRIVQAGPASPDGVRLLTMLGQRIEHARKIYYTRLALASVRARRRKKERWSL